MSSTLYREPDTHLVPTAPTTRILPRAAEQQPGESPASERRYRADVDGVRYWVGAAMTAGVAAMTGVLGLTLTSGVLGLPVRLDEAGRMVGIHVGGYALLAAALAVAAAALYNLMLHLAPRPATYYGCLAGLGTALLVLLPFTTVTPLSSQIALACLDLAVGLIITLMVPMAAVRARR